MLLISAAAPGTASARSHRGALDPSPQRAPTSASPSPDPAPQATVKSQPTHVTRPPTTSAPVGADITRRATRLTVPARSGPARIGDPVSHATTHAQPVAHRHAARRLVPSAPPTRTSPVALSVPLSFIATDLLRLTSGLRAGAAARPEDGVLLLLSSLAMAALAVSSLALLRRLKRFGGEPR